MSKFAILSVIAAAVFATEAETEAERQGWNAPQGYQQGGYYQQQSYGQAYAAPQASYQVGYGGARGGYGAPQPVHSAHVHAAPAEPASPYYNDGYLRQDRTEEGPYETVYAKCALQDPEEEAYVRGALQMQQSYGGPVRITGTIIDVTPGPHGFHIHELGDLREGCGSTGGHLDFGAGGSSDYSEKMTGDLKMAVADKSGVAVIEETNGAFDLFGTYSVIGRSLVIHKKSDDAKGGAGARIACCTIGHAAGPQKKW